MTRFRVDPDSFRTTRPYDSYDVIDESGLPVEIEGLDMSNHTWATATMIAMLLNEVERLTND